MADMYLPGGALARPAAEYPAVFGKMKFFHDYPYALPTFVTGSIGAIATVASAVGIKEVNSPEYHERLSD